MSTVDQTMATKRDHVQYLMELSQAMSDAGFDNIRILDDDLEPLSVQEHGSTAVIKEMMAVDDGVTLTAEWPRHSGDIPPYDEPYRVGMLFILCNDAWESLADHTIPCDRVDEVLSEITSKLEEKYL